jgi:hypothetical protein
MNDRMHVRAELRRVSTGAFPAVCGTRGETGVALAADLFVAVVFGGQDLQ